MRILPFTLLLLMMGCGGGDPAAKKEASSQDLQQETVFDPMTQTIDRARDVEELSMSRSDDLDRQIEESE